MCAQPGMVDRVVLACVEEGDVLVFEDVPSVSPVLFAVSRSMWEGVLVSAPPASWCLVRSLRSALGDSLRLETRNVWVTRDGERLTREEFARVVQNTTMPVVVNPAELRWYERLVDE